MVYCVLTPPAATTLPVRVQVTALCRGVRRSQDIINEAGAGRSCAGRSGACRGVSSKLANAAEKPIAG